MSSDAAFESIISLVVENFDFNLLGILKRVVVFIMVFFPLYGFFYGLRNKKMKTSDQKEKNTNANI